MVSALHPIPEPNLVFRHDQVAVDPRIGLSVFGPYDADLASRRRSLPYGVVGRRRGVAALGEFIQALRGPVVTPTKAASPTLWPAFPGFEAAFHSELPSEASATFEIDPRKIETAASNADQNLRAFGVVDLYLEAIRDLLQREGSIDVVVCVVPDLVYQNCRPKSHPSEVVGPVTPSAERKARSRGIRDITAPEASISPFRFSPDFRRQIKARAMIFEPPIQIMRESTLRLPDNREMGERVLTPLSDRAWNLATALYFKAGGRPWKLASGREGVCYVGVVFHRAVGGPDGRYAACAAQMFLDDGDGVVLRGESGPWYTPETRQFHLTRNAAEKLLQSVLAEYGVGHGKPLREIFLHYRASIARDEFEGYRTACPPGVKLVGVKVRSARDEIRLYREGTRPVLRGSLLKLGHRAGYLWASGFKPWLRTYDGWEVPAPLDLRVEHGEADLAQVATDIIGLTKLNYNECRLGDAQPVTIGFSNQVGEILVSNPGAKNPRSRFKYYI